MNNPQSQNIYIYVLDNPLKYVDPSGHSHSYYRGMAYDYYYNTDQPTSEGFNDYLENNKAEDLSRYVNDYFIGAGKTILDTVNPVTYYNMLKFGAFYSNAGPGVQVIINTQISLNLQQQYQDFRQKPIGQKNDVMMQIMGGVTADWMLGLGIDKMAKSAKMTSLLNKFDNTGNLSRAIKEVTGSTDIALEPYKGVKEASEYLRSKGVPRKYRKQILESFEIETIYMDVANNNTFALRYHDFGIKANKKGRYLFESFQPLSNRRGTAILWDWNDMTGIKQWKIRLNTPLIKGKAAPQLDFGSEYTGGIEQWYVNDLMNLIEP